MCEWLFFGVSVLWVCVWVSLVFFFGVSVLWLSVWVSLVYFYFFGVSVCGYVSGFLLFFFLV